MTLNEVGPLLYGPLWQTPLAQALGVQVRTVQRWAAGEFKPKPATWAAIRDLLHERQHELADALKAMPR